MDIKEFLELSVGQWFSQRTIHNLSSGQLQAGKSNLTITLLPQNEPSITQLCSHHQVDAAIAWGGLKLSWEGTMEGESKQQTGSTLLVPLIDSDSPQEGQFLQKRPGYDDHAFKGSYLFGEDEVLVLITETDNFYVEERLWYLMPNLRLRTSVFKHTNGISQASFCSEIRRIGS